MPGTPPRNRSQFVSVMAWLSLGLALVGVATGILQGLMLAMTGTGPGLLDMLAAGTGAAPLLPPGMLWILEHLGLLTWLSVLSSVVGGVASWGLLQRREWGRITFIALLALGALAAIACAFAFAGMIDWINAQPGMADLASADPLVSGMQMAMKTVMHVSAWAIVALHGGIAWKLCTPAVRAEFA